jgi:hypothetical protein
MESKRCWLRIGWTIQPIERTDSFGNRLVSDILIKLCLSFLFGYGSSIVYSPDLDLVSTSLVMVAKKSDEWHATMSGRGVFVLVLGLGATPHGF